MRFGFVVAGPLSLASLFASSALGGSQSNRSSSEVLVLGCFDSGIDPKTWYLFHGTTGSCVDLRFTTGTAGSDSEGTVIEGGRRTDICDSNIVNDHVPTTEIARPMIDNLNVAMTVAVNGNRQAFRCLFGYCVALLDPYTVHNSRRSSQAYLSEKVTKLLSRCAVEKGPSVEAEERLGIRTGSQATFELGPGEQLQHRPVPDGMRYLLVYLPQSTLVITRADPLLLDK